MGRFFQRRDTDHTRTDESTLLSFDDNRTDDVLETLGSETARTVFRTLIDAPQTTSEVAETVDLSVEGVRYHIENLESAGIIEVIDTTYSEKGREMDIYAPSEDPLLVVLGSLEDEQSLRTVFADLVPAIGPTAVLIAIGETLRRMDLSDLLDKAP